MRLILPQSGGKRAATPLLAGYLLSKSSTGWPLVIAGTGKIAYDLTLLRLFGAAES